LLKIPFTDNIPGLLAALGSAHPDSTIRVRAAYDKSKRQQPKLMSLNPNLRLINQINGFADLRNCYYYFAGNASKTNTGQTLGNYKDIDNICTDITLTINFPATVISFLSDSHVSVFLYLYKSSKNLIK
jgi:hypothetical protein